MAKEKCIRSKTRGIERNKITIIEKDNAKLIISVGINDKSPYVFERISKAATVLNSQTSHREKLKRSKASRGEKQNTRYESYIRDASSENIEKIFFVFHTWKRGKLTIKRRAFKHEDIFRQVSAPIKKRLTLEPTKRQCLQSQFIPTEAQELTLVVHRF